MKKDSISKKLYITTSWDDGSVNDLKLRELLDKHAIKGTFYVPKEFAGKGSKFSEYRRRLTDQEIREIALSQEIGSHALTHRSLLGLGEEEVRKEISESKTYLENIIGGRVKMFCPPNGLFDERVMQAAKDAGYSGIRTTRKLSFDLSRNKPFCLDVSIIAHPFPLRKKDSERIYWRRATDPLRAYGRKLLLFPALYANLFSWQSFARAFFNYALAHGNYFHLYGHSWELEKYQMWAGLEEFLEYTKEFNNVEYMSNSQVAEIITHENTHID